MKAIPVALLILALVLGGAINVFSIHFGATDPRPLVRVASVSSGLLALLCALVIPGAIFRFLLSADSLILTQSLFTVAIVFTVISLLLDVVIAMKLRRTAA